MVVRWARTGVLVLATSMFICLLGAAYGTDSGSDCGGAADMTGASAHCIKSGNQTNAYIGAHSDHTYSIRPACDVGGLAICSKPAQCHVGDHDGWLYNVYED
jgi:hypothetical protein